MKNILKKYYLIFIIIGIICIKQILVNGIPIYAISNAVCDDRLMANIATYLLKFEWLGDYNQLTLVKGIFFPLYLAINVFLGISYIGATTALYSLACLIFVYSIKDLIKNKWFLLIIFTILIFNPVSYGQETLQRVYRNSITASQVLIIFSAFFKMYLNRDKKITKMLPWALLGGFTLASFVNNREDWIWIMPFIIVVTMVIIVTIIMKNKNIKQNISKIIVVIVPLIILFAVNTTISTINYKYYNIYSYNEINNSDFSDAMKAIYSVENEEEIEYVSVTREKMKRLYEISPSLNLIKDNMENYLDGWSKTDRNPDDLEVEDGWFFWCLRDAVYASGYYKDGQTANEYYKKVAEEINEAIDSGLVESQPTMPSALMSPWRKGYTAKITDAMLKIIVYVPSFTDVSTTTIASTGNIEGIKAMEILTNNNAIYPDSYGEAAEAQIAVYKVYTSRLNAIGSIYKKTGFLVFILGLTSYILLVIKMFAKKEKNIDIILLLTGILLSYLVLVLGVAYNHIASCYSITYMYLSGAYPLVIAFSTISIFKLISKKHS